MTRDGPTTANASLYFKVQQLNRNGDEDWLDRTTLEKLGFDCGPPLSADTEEFHYDKLLPREGFVVLEFDGAAWAGWLAKQQAEIDELSRQVEQGESTEEELERRRKRFERSSIEDSRLFPVDAGRDPEALRAKYADRAGFLIVAAVFDLAVEASARPDATRQHRELRTRIEQVLVDTIHVSKRHRQIFDSLEAPAVPDVAGPRYTATVAFGSRYEPWLVGAESTGE